MVEEQRCTHDGREEAGRRLDVARVGELNVRAAGDKAVDPEPGERDEVLLALARRELDRQRRVAVLADDDRGERERRFLARGADERDALGLVLEVVGCDGRVVRNLLDSEVRLAPAVAVGPVAEKELAEDRVKGPTDGSKVRQPRRPEARCRARRPRLTSFRYRASRSGSCTGP